MADQTDSLLSPSEIEERLGALERAGFPKAQSQRLTLDLARFCRGVEAEQALSRLVGALPPEQVHQLIADHVMTRHPGASTTDYCGAHFFMLAEELTRRQFTVTSTDITLPDGTELATMLRGVHGEREKIWLCRLALWGVWILGMRTRAPQPPAY